MRMLPLFRGRLVAAGLLLGVAAAAAAAPAAPASRAVDERRAADPQGQVEIHNVAGRVEIVGWDKSEVHVSGTLGADVERLEVTTTGPRTTVRVVVRENHGSSSGWHSSNVTDANLVVQVPQRSGLTATTVSADLSATGISGNQEIQTVSGNVKTAAEREVRVHTVSGDLHLNAGAESRRIDLSTVSGDLMVAGGAGELTISTVSGDGVLTLGTLDRAHIKTVSGDFSIEAGLAANGRLEAESVSGDYNIEFTGTLPPAAFDVKSFSGDLSTCFGRKPSHSEYGPGSRLTFQEGTGSAHVRVDTQSGDVTLCTKR